MRVFVGKYHRMPASVVMPPGHSELIESLLMATQRTMCRQ
jgi:hypothetical protein